MKKNEEKWRKIGTFLGKMEKKREKKRKNAEHFWFPTANNGNGLFATGQA